MQYPTEEHPHVKSRRLSDLTNPKNNRRTRGLPDKTFIDLRHSWSPDFQDSNYILGLIPPIPASNHNLNGQNYPIRGGRLRPHSPDNYLSVYPNKHRPDLYKTQTLPPGITFSPSRRGPKDIEFNFPQHDKACTTPGLNNNNNNNYRKLNLEESQEKMLDMLGDGQVFSNPVGSNFSSFSHQANISRISMNSKKDSINPYKDLLKPEKKRNPDHSTTNEILKVGHGPEPQPKPKPNPNRVSINISPAQPKDTGEYLRPSPSELCQLQSLATFTPNNDLMAKKQSVGGFDPSYAITLAALLRGRRASPYGTGALIYPSSNVPLEPSETTSWWEMLYDFSQSTSLHGIGYVARPAKFTMRRIIWSLLVLASLALFIYYMYSRIVYYLQFNTSASVAVNYLARVSFPAVTFCNQNFFKITATANLGWYGVIEKLYTSDPTDLRDCMPNMEFKCITSKSCIPITQRCDMFPDCSDASDEWNCDPCPLFFMDSQAQFKTGRLGQYLGQFYEVQRDTFNSNEAVYCNRNTGAVKQPWLFYNNQTKQWQIADRYYGLQVVGYSETFPDSTKYLNGSRWTFNFTDETFQVPQVYFTCTYDYSQLLQGNSTNDNATIGLSLSDLYQHTGYQINDLIPECLWKGKPCGDEDIQPFYTDMGLCFTFNNNDMYVENAGPGYGLSFTANIAQYEYTKGTDKGVGLKLLLHDVDDIPQMVDRGTAVSPGLRSFIAVETTEVVNLEPPFGNCGDIKLSYFDVYTVGTCMLECETKFLYRRCGCVDIHMPTDNGKMPICDVYHYVNCLQPKLEEMRASGNYCTCPTPCRTNSYVPSASFSVVMSSDGADITSKAQNLTTSLSAARETAFRVKKDKFKATHRNLHDLMEGLSHMEKFSMAASGTLASGFEAIQEDVLSVQADCIWMHNTLTSARTDINYYLLHPVLKFEMTFARALSEFYAIETAANDAIATVDNFYDKGWDLSSPNLLKYLSSLNATVFNNYASLTLTLTNQASVFWNDLIASINILPTQDHLSFDREYIEPILPLIGNHCIWCMTTTEESVQQIVRSRVLQYLGVDARNSMNNAAGYLFQAYEPFLEDLWVANMSGAVRNADRSNYDSYMRQLGSELKHLWGRFDLVIRDIRDSTEMIDDLVGFLWTQQCLIQLPELIGALKSSEGVSQIILTSNSVYMREKEQNIQSLTNSYDVKNISLQNLASSIDYQDITTTVTSNQVKLETELSKRSLKSTEVYTLINRINYVLMCIVNDSTLASQSLYWKRFSVTKPIPVPPTVMSVGNVTVPNNDYSINFTGGVVYHWNELNRNVKFLNEKLSVQKTNLLSTVSVVQTYMNSFVDGNQLSSAFYSQNFLQVDLFFKELTERSVVQQKAYTFENLLSELGGILGLLLGASALTVFEILDVLLYTAIVKCAERSERCKANPHPPATHIWE